MLPVDISAQTSLNLGGITVMRLKYSKSEDVNNFQQNQTGNVFFIWIPISLHRVVACTPEVHKKTIPIKNNNLKSGSIKQEKVKQKNQKESNVST